MSNADLEAALAAFGARDPHFLSHSENEVYRVQHRGRPAALRLHRPGYQTRDQIWSELWWMQALAERGVPVPGALPARDGSLIAGRPGGRVASLVTWVKGAPLADDTATPAAFHRIGALLARLHNVTDQLDLPARFTRHAWDVDGLMGEAPLWGRFWESPALDPAGRQTLLAARDKARAELSAYRARGGDYGLIHADPIRGNVFVDGDQVTLIDFDDAGWGFRAYDLAVLMTQNLDRPDARALLDAAIAGYRSERALPHATEAVIPTLILARRMASTGWIMTRKQIDREWMVTYADRAVALARDYLAG